jgi:hypothetical protein
MIAFDRVAQLLARCGTIEAVLPPTLLFNEGWMLRLVLDWYEGNSSPERRLVFERTSRWYSEALLPSRFFAKFRGDARAEGWTHADGVIGQFRIRRERGDIELDREALQLTVTEAKMASGLTPGTTRAPSFDQAARNVACIAQVLSVANCRAESLSRLEFFVLAPASRITEGAFSEQLEKRNIERKVRDRASAFGSDYNAWLDEWFVPTIEKCNIGAVAWEDLIADIADADKVAGEALGSFYAACLKHNPISSG